MKSSLTTEAVGFNENKAGELIPSVSIERLLAMRGLGLQKYESALKLMTEAEELFKAAASKELYGYHDCVKNDVYNATSKNNKNVSIQKFIDRKIWERLMSETGMYTFMNTKQRQAWDSSLNSNDMPEVSLDNVIATFHQLHASKKDTFEQGVMDLFRNLSWDYKTNNPCKFGKKIIINGFMDAWNKNYIRFSSLGQSRLDDLARPFYILDNRNIPDCRCSDGIKFNDFYNKHGFSGELYEGEYFSVRAYKKGSGHIVFKRPDLVEKLNNIIARHYPGALPPAV